MEAIMDKHSKDTSMLLSVATTRSEDQRMIISVFTSVMSMVQQLLIQIPLSTNTPIHKTKITTILQTIAQHWMEKKNWKEENTTIWKFTI